MAQPGKPAPPPSLKAAAEAYGRGEWQAAEVACRAVLAARPDDADTLHLLALLRERAGDRDAALAGFRRALALAPDNAALPINAARALRRAGEIDEAVAVLAALLERRSDDPETVGRVRPHLARLAIDGCDAGALDTADRAAALLERLDAGDYGAQLVRCQIAQQRGDALGAARRFRRFVAGHPLQAGARPAAPARPQVGVLIGAADFGYAFEGRVPVLGGGHFEYPHALEGVADLGAIYLAGDPGAAVAARCRDRFDVILNAVADPEQLPRSLDLAAAFAPRIGRPLINDPAAVRLTTRDRVAAIVGSGDGFVMPRTVRATAGPAGALSTAAEAAGLAYPLLVRPCGSQTGRGLVKADAPADLAAAEAPLAGRAVYLTEFHDFASPDGRYRKYRCFRIGDGVAHEHLLIGDGWLVHGHVRDRVMKGREWAEREEAAWIAEGRMKDAGDAPHPALARVLDRVQQATGLDYFGIDVAVLPDGRLLVFEANPCMRTFNPDWGRDYPHTLPGIENIRRAFARLLAARIPSPR